MMDTVFTGSHIYNWPNKIWSLGMLGMLCIYVYICACTYTYTQIESVLQLEGFDYFIGYCMEMETSTWQGQSSIGHSIIIMLNRICSFNIIRPQFYLRISANAICESWMQLTSNYLKMHNIIALRIIALCKLGALNCTERAVYALFYCRIGPLWKTFNLKKRKIELRNS